MQFCDECGSMMHADVAEQSSAGDRTQSSNGGEMVCSSCGHRVPKDDDLSEQYTSTEEQSEDDVIESDPDADFEGKPTADDVTCEKCGHGTAWYTIKQTGSADEPPTRFFKCQECGYRWREYS